MTHRVVSQLAHAQPTPPPSLRFARAEKNAKGSRAKGYTYQRVVGRKLRDLGLTPLSSQWFSFHDAAGHGYCQIDHLVLFPTGVLLIECKLTQTDSAFLQMSQLYVPILEFIYKRPVITLQACRGLRYPPQALREPLGLLAQPEFGNFTWHYSGR